MIRRRKNMIRRLSDLPAIGATITDIDDPDLPILTCILHLGDPDDKDTVYGLFASIDKSLNTHHEFGVDYYKIFGYTDLHDGR